MDGDEKLAALKKAYADVIFNISKEAAIRVMASDKRALRYEHELKVGKEEALRMLMHLKQLVELKTSEAAAASLNQQKKIEVLEAQLEEAEDIVNDLRIKLGRAQAEVEQVRQDNMRKSNQPTDAISSETENGVYSYDSAKSFPLQSRERMSGVIVPNPNQSNRCCKCGDIIACPCSSYIRNRVFLSVTNQKNNSRERERREKEEGEDTSKAVASSAETQSKLKKQLLPDRKFRNPQSFSRERKRAARKKKKVTPLSVKHASDIVNGSDFMSENLFETASVLSRIKTETESFLLGSEKSLGKETNIVEISGDITQRKDEGLKKTLASIDGEAGFEYDLMSPDSKTDIEKVGFLLNCLKSNSCHMNAGLSQSVGERVIKYTFQRKRKREAFKESNAIVEIKTEKETEAKQNGCLNAKQSKTSFLIETSRESRRLAQVAHQLISLSEKKQWD